MVRTASVVSTVLITLVMAASTAAQSAAPAAPRQERNDLRHQIYVMEGALARAVQFGASQVNREIRNVSPELFSLAGEAQARGVYLEGYGVFFDVGVPVLRQSMMWSFRQLVEQDDRVLRDTISILKRQLAGMRDPIERRNLEITISSLELRLPDAPRNADSLAQPAAGVSAAMIAPEGMPPAAPAPGPPAVSPEARRVLKDPNRAYTESVQRALIDAMIDYSAPMVLSESDWLTVAARDNEPRDTFAPQDPYEEVVTILLRIRGADLAAYRAGTIDREEAKRRVELREF
jgi:hypothetical protein